MTSKYRPKPRTTKLATANDAKLLAIRHLRPAAVSIITKQAFLRLRRFEADRFLLGAP
jgi:hypothetical protein